MSRSRKLNRTEPPTTLSGGRLAAATTLMKDVLPELEFAGQPVDLVAVDVERYVVDRPHLAIDAKIGRLIISPERVDA